MSDSSRNTKPQSCTVCGKPGTFKCECCTDWYCSKSCRKAKNRIDLQIINDLKKARSGDELAAVLQGLDLNRFFTATPNSNAYCSNCGKLGPNKKCSACSLRQYCSKECQLQDWKSGHKDFCKKASKRVEKTKDVDAAVCPKCNGPMDSAGAKGALCAACSE